ncbi:MAG TPA: lipopolysaccharide biosynthesis protein [Polyangiaceae bacterium]|nr:lipopolysaccharide biosynthesis protein [Polyangiaceae bacterium]
MTAVDGTLQGSAARTGTSPSGTAETARAAGRGGVAVLGAKVFFLVTGFIQQPLLRFAVGLNDFGALAQALVVANTVNNVVVSSGTQGVSRVVASAPGREDEVLRATLRVHGPMALFVAGAMALAAPVYARFEHAEDVIPPLLVLAAVALLYGLYAPLIGYLNGRNRFGRQAALDVTFATMRTVGLVAFGRAFVTHGLSGVLGTTIGWVAAAFFIVPLALRSTGWGRKTAADRVRPAGVPTPKAYITLLLPIAGAQLCTNALLQADIALLGRFLSESAAPMSSSARDAVKSSLAIYKECQTFAFLPYQLLFSVTLVLFPMLARAHAEGDAAAVREYVARGARLAAIFGGLLVAVIVAMPESMLAFAYGTADAHHGAEVLRTMALAQGAFAMLGIATTVLTSIGRERAAAWLTLGALVAVMLACTLLVPAAPFGHAQLVRSAQATAIAFAIALVIAAMLVRAQTGAFVPAWTALRVGIALVACFALGACIPHVGRLLTPVIALFVAAAYLIVLVATREIGPAEIGWLRTLVARRR